MDGRGLGMKGERLFVFRHDAYLKCLEASTGREIWSKSPESDPGFFKRFENYYGRSVNKVGWQSSPLFLCGPNRLFIVAPPFSSELSSSLDHQPTLEQVA